MRILKLTPGAVLLLLLWAQGDIAGQPAPITRQAKKTVVRKANQRPYHQRPYQVGRATWYGERFHGRPTASGEQYDMFQFTAAHQTLPIGSRVRVTHLRSRRSVVVRVNDRGPKAPAIIDLSFAAARHLGSVSHGNCPVRLDLVNEPARERVIAQVQVMSIEKD